MNTKNYDVDFFIDFFETIPYNRWLTCDLGIDRKEHCAIGHVLTLDTNSQTLAYECFRDCKDVFIKNALLELFWRELGIWVIDVNNRPSTLFPQNNPRDRILAALYQIKEKQEKENLVVDKTTKEELVLVCN